MKIIRVVLVPFRAVWVLCFWIPYRCWYFRRKWRYAVSFEVVRQFSITVNQVVVRMKGENGLPVDSRFAMWWYWFFANTILKGVYRHLKKNHSIKEEVSAEACRLFRVIVELFLQRSDEILTMLMEIRHASVKAFQNHPLDNFKKCRGNIYNEGAAQFLREILAVSPSAIEAMKAAYEYALQGVKRQTGCASDKMHRIFTLFDAVQKMIGVIEDSPAVLSEAMTMHSEILARWTLEFGDYSAAQAATLASQSMKTVCSRIRTRKCNSKYHAALDDYFMNIRHAGAALYNHLIEPPRLPAPPETLPPTRERAEEQLKMANMEAAVMRLERENALARENLNVVKQKLRAAIAGGREQPDPVSDAVGAVPEKTGDPRLDRATAKVFCHALAQRLIDSKKVDRVHNYPSACNYILSCANGEPFYSKCVWVRKAVETYDWQPNSLLTFCKGGGKSRPKPDYTRQAKTARRRKQQAEDWMGVGLPPPDCLQ